MSVITSFVCVEAMGRVSGELMAAAEQFADSVDATTLNPATATDELMRQFRAATPEFEPGRHSEASDPRAALCFSLVRR